MKSMAMADPIATAISGGITFFVLSLMPSLGFACKVAFDQKVCGLIRKSVGCTKSPGIASFTNRSDPKSFVGHVPPGPTIRIRPRIRRLRRPRRRSRRL